MCFQCGGGGWPWSHPVHLAPPPVKEEVIYLDENPGFYADTRQGIHPPGQVWTSNQPAAQQYQYYNYPGAPTAPTGYFYNGQYGQFPMMPTGTTIPTYYYYNSASTSAPAYYYSASPYSSDALSSYYQNYYTNFYQNFYRPSLGSYPLSSYNMYRNPYSYMQYLVPGGPAVLPIPTCPAAMSAQAATALANNAALAAMPTAPSYWVGANPADHAAQQAIVAGMMGYQVNPAPTQLAPYKPADGQQFWCKELDGSWTLRTHNDIIVGGVSPGHWERHTSSGYFYWVRHAT